MILRDLKHIYYQYDMKTCVKCQKEKSTDLFSVKQDNHDGHSNICKECMASYLNQWYNKNKNKLRSKRKVLYETKKEQWKPVQKKYYELNKNEILQRQREYVKIPEVRNRRRETINKWTTERCRKDPNFKLRRTISTRIWHALKGTCKSAKTQQLLGCNSELLKNHLEQKFLKGMTWNNYGKQWHIDHIIPCDSFDLTLPDEQKKCFHYTNLQPLWARDNQKKGNKMTYPL